MYTSVLLIVDIILHSFMYKSHVKSLQCTKIACNIEIALKKLFQGTSSISGNVWWFYTTSHCSCRHDLREQRVSSMHIKFGSSIEA